MTDAPTETKKPLGVASIPDTEGDVIFESPPSRVSWACAEVTNEWVDDDRAADLEDDEHQREFWSDVRAKLRAWPGDGP